MELRNRPSLLCWLHGESLFSICSRQHRFWGFSHPSETCERLFGAPFAGTHHDLPNHLAELAIRTDSAWGTANDLAKQRTLLKFYATFGAEGTVEECVSAMSGSSVAHLRFRLGLCTSRFGANHPLKACYACMKDDIDSKGWPYWHLEHQYPGVWVCRKHGLTLCESLFKSTGVARFEWQLPAKDKLKSRAIKGGFGIDEPSEAATKFAKLVVELIERGVRFEIPRLRALYVRELDRLGLVTPGGRVRLGRVAEGLLPHSLALRPAPDLRAFPANFEEARANAARLFWAPRSATHPLRHVLMIDWLFRDAASFFNAYAEVANAPTETVQGLAAEDYAQVRIEEVRGTGRPSSTPGMTPRVAGLEVGTPETPHVTEVTSIKTGGPRRGPRRIKGRLRRELVAKLAAGEDAQILSDKFKVAKTTVYRLLRSVPDLLATRTEAQDRLVRDAARQRWLYAVEKHGQLGLQRVRMLEPATYSRLYRNDRAWLDEHKPPRVKMDFGRRKGVSWSARDLVLSAQVQRALKELPMARPGDRLHLWQICQAVPEVKAKRRVLDRLPLTRQVVDAALRRGARGSSMS